MKIRMGLFTFSVMVGLVLGGRSQADEAAKPQGTSRGPVRFACGDSSAVVVNIFKEGLPVEAERLERFLWNNFMNKPEEESFTCPVRGWEERYHSFSRSLIEKATAQSLEGESLRKSLDFILADTGKNAYLPVGAYYATFQGNPAWIVVVKWEWSKLANELLSHARVYVIEVKSTRIVGFVTCS